MRPPENRHARVIELQMTSMVDVVFLLLVFFLWTTSFEQPEYDLGGAIALPPIGTAALASPDVPIPPAFDEIVIRLTQPGGQANVEIRFNDRVVSGVGELGDRLREIVSLGAQPPVIVDPDDTVPMGAAIAIYDVVRAAGIDRVLLAVEES